MEFVKKDKINEVAEKYAADRRAEALQVMHEEVAALLQEALKKAENWGEQYGYRDRTLTIPEYFKDTKGFYHLPEEIEEELAAAGYQIKIRSGNHYSLI